MSRPARRVALNLLREWEQGTDYAADLIEQAVKKGALASKDRPLVQQLVYTVIRNQTLLDHLVKQRAEGKLDPKTKRILRLGLAEGILLEGAPHATVNETVSLGTGWAKGVINAILRRSLEEKERILAEIDGFEPSVRWSVPRFLWKRWERQFGEQNAIALAQWNQQAAPVYVRANSLKNVELSGFPGLSRVENESDYYRVEGDLPKRLLEEGAVYAQDPSTAVAIRLLDASPGELVLDACAAPGGKTLGIACAMKNQGRIIAADNSPGRIERLQANLRRLNVDIAECVTIDWLNEEFSAKGIPGRFDRVLLDVPCSNTGVMRRRIDVRWRLEAGDFEDLHQVQLRLLGRVSVLLKPGGRLVYSTCSLETDENEAVVEEFLAENPDFCLIAQKRVLPWQDGFDGAFAAALERL